MGTVWMPGGSGGGASSDDCTAGKAQVLSGYTAVTRDSDDEAAAGAMPNRGAWTSRIGVNGKAAIPAGYHNGSGYVDQAITNRGAVNASLGINGTYTIPEGYHNGAGKVTQSIATMGAQTVAPGNSQKVVPCSGKYMTGNVTVQAVSNLIAANIKKGVTVGGVVGTWEGYVAAPTDIYNNGAIGQWGIFGGAKRESNCIVVNVSGNDAASSPSSYVLSTDSAVNLTGYRSLNVEFSRATGGRCHIYAMRGATASTIGNTIGTALNVSDGNNTRSTISIPLSAQNVTDRVGAYFIRLSGGNNATIYRMWLS